MNTQKSSTVSKQEQIARTDSAIAGLSEEASLLVTSAYQLAYCGYVDTEGENGVWIERGMTLFRAVAQAYCYEQKSAGTLGSHRAKDVLDALSFDTVERLYMNGYQESLCRNGEWSSGYSLIKDYLDDFLPAYDSRILMAQHGHIDLDSEFKYGRKFTSTSDLKQQPMAQEKHQYFVMSITPALAHLGARMYRNRAMAS